MDITAWIDPLERELREKGQERLIELIGLLPDLVHENEIAQAEAVAPEAIAGARALKHPWLEIYFRHWDMRNRLASMMEGETALAEVIALFEFAHREGNRDCPQSVCTTHDMVNCYANIDGIGWAAERKDVCEETLARITPEWGCYECLTAEFIYALVDEGRYEEAHARLDALEKARPPVERYDDQGLLRTRIYIRAQAGEYAKALELLDRADAYDDPISTSRRAAASRVVIRAFLLVQLGRREEAWESMPGFDELTPRAYPLWARTVFLLSREEPRTNTWSLGACFVRMIRHFHKKGAHRFVLDVGEAAIELAAARGARWNAALVLALVEEHTAKLRYPEAEADRIARLRALVDAIPEPVLPVPAEGLHEYLQERRNKAPDGEPEEEAALCLSALQANPALSISHVKCSGKDLSAHPCRETGVGGLCPPSNDHFKRPLLLTPLVLAAVAAMRQCAAYDEALALLEAHVTADPFRDEAALVSYLQVCLEAGTPETALALVEQCAGDAPLLAARSRAYLAFHSSRWDVALEEAERGLAHAPGDADLMFYRAYALKERREYARACAAFADLAAHEKGRGKEYMNYQLELLVMATLAEQWALARATAAALDFAVKPGEGPIEEDWGWIVAVFAEGHRENRYYARRTGPCTAVVANVAHPEDEQHLHDVVVFDPRYTEPLPENEDEREEYTAPHRVVAVVSRGGYASWLCGGADPGEAVFSAFCDALEAHGCQGSLWADEGYMVNDPARPGTTGALPGRLFLVATPPGMSAVEAHGLMTRLTKGWPHPVVWYGLAEAAGADLAPQRAILERYGME